MIKKSARGIYFNTKDSEEYYFIYNDLKFYFSSEFNLRRFKDKVCGYTFQENEKFINKYKIKIELINYFIFALYQEIEKRGYKVKNIKNNNMLINDKKIDIAFVTTIKEC
jgi:hypothetical protein